MASTNPSIGRRNRRYADVHGHLPRHGASARFCRLNGLLPHAVMIGLKDGQYIVGPDGEIVTSGKPPRPKPAKRPTVDWRENGPRPAFGAIQRAAKAFKLTVWQVYSRLKHVEFIVDPVTREIVRAPGKPTAETGFPVNSKPLAVEPAPLAQPSLELRPTLPIDPVIGLHRAGWERAVDAWQQQAIELAAHRPADWTLTRSDALRYLRDRLSGLVELAAQDEAAHPATAEQKAQRIADAINIGRKVAATKRLPDGTPLEAVDAARK